MKTIILGGQDRGNDFSELGRRITNSSIANVILFPGSGPRIREAIETSGARVQVHETQNMEEAVTIAKQQTSNQKLETNKPPIVLLSTASPSYGMFKNFEEKGEAFQRCIESS